ncbi:MAG: Fe-S cluster assembly protein IscX [Chloroflexi bacterium]|nr:Fe-S cluster assembly protein IscX [Chloroflexota bacterium]
MQRPFDCAAHLFLTHMVLYWDATYAIALALMEAYPGRDPVEIGLGELAHMVETLPSFSDDPALVTERILQDIQITWYEEKATP